MCEYKSASDKKGPKIDRFWSKYDPNSTFMFCIHTRILILILSAYMILHQILAVVTTANT